MLFGFVLFVLIALTLLHLAAVADLQGAHWEFSQQCPTPRRSAPVRNVSTTGGLVVDLPAASTTPLSAELHTERRRYEALQHAYEQLQQEHQQLQLQLQQLQHSVDLTGRSPLLEADFSLLQQECERLRQDLEIQPTQIAQALQHAIFDKLQTLLTSYPSIQKITQHQPDLPAKNLTALFTPLDNLRQDWGWQTIGTAWEAVPYDPQLHQPDSSDIQPGDIVYIRFVGYRQGDHILCPAKVSRSLPVAANNGITLES